MIFICSTESTEFGLSVRPSVSVYVSHKAAAVAAAHRGAFEENLLSPQLLFKELGESLGGV